MPDERKGKMQLPEPRYDSDYSIEKAIFERRSIRYYTRESLMLEELSQLLWAAQGITSRRSERSSPSAGALYPLEVYAATGDVDNLEPAVYRYQPANHEIETMLEGDIRALLADAALEQQYIAEGAAVIVITSVFERITQKYGERGIRYAHMEAGHTAQNIYLQAAALKLGTVAIGAFQERRVMQLMNLANGEEPLYIVPVGRKA